MRAYFILVFLYCTGLQAQTAFHNFGNIQIHDEGAVGFHADFINDGDFDQNLGFAGFYNFNGFRTVSGDNRAVFYDLEVDVLDDLELYTSLGVRNIMEYTTGRVITPRDDISISLDYLNFDIYLGEGDTEHTDGYASITGSNEFIFPIGDDVRLRPMIIPNQSNQSYFRGAFFYENPNTPTTFSTSFDTSNKENFIKNISNYEFWDLDGTEETEVTLTWDVESNIPLIADTIELLRVVGWGKDDNKWKDLGQIDVTGDLSEGTITSIAFIPDDYEVLTIGSKLDDSLESINYAISPNGDGANDYLVIPGIELQPNNKLEIYNRWGALVYGKKSYTNDWQGTAEEGGLVLNKKEGLPDGVYFYALTFDGEERTHTGWIYIRR